MDRANTGTATPSSMALPDPADACLAAPFGMPVELLPNLYLVRVPLPHNPLRALNSGYRTECVSAIICFPQVETYKSRR